MMPRGLIDRLMEAASIERWNDYPRPVELTELDKQAHKALIAWVLARIEQEEAGREIDLCRLVEGFLFELLPRTVLTDIKPPVFYRLAERFGGALNAYVFRELEPDLEGLPASFRERFVRYVSEPDTWPEERKILHAAHYLASRWEFRIIHHTTPFLHGIDMTRNSILEEIERYADLVGVGRIREGSKLAGFVDLCGRLRFQVRWAGTPRLPRTAVLGHLAVVSVLTYLAALTTGKGPEHRAAAFLGGLFHDLPEALTRDIVAPVKRSVEGLEDEIARIEHEFVNEDLLPLLPAYLHKEVLHFVESPFRVRVQVGGETVYDDPDAEGDLPVDGRVLEACDHLAAFAEATASIRHGVMTRHIENALRDLHTRYRGSIVGGVPIGEWFDAVAASEYGA